MSTSVLTTMSGAAHLLGWSLLHFVWQAAIIALVLAAALAMARNSRPQIRYLLCCAALALMALCPISTLAYLANADMPHAVPPFISTHAAAPSTPQQSHAISLLDRAIEVANHAMPWILTIWITGVLLLLVRAITAGIAAQRLKTDAIIEVQQNLRTLAMRMAEHLGITQAIQIFASHAVTAPAVIGWLKPVILLPVASLSGLSPEQVEAILAHELAHIRRRDYLVNALQVAAETLLFYHPAVWWVSRQIRQEREHCCDDVVVAMTNSPLVYAKALYLLEEQRAITPQLTLGANGGQLTMRIRRLLTGKQQPTTEGSIAWLVIITLLFLTAAFTASTLTPHRVHAQSATSAREIPAGEAQEHLLGPLLPPKYPEIAKAAHVSGTVSIAIVITAKGEVEEAHVVSGPTMLRQAALDSVIHNKYSPFTEYGGQPVTTTLEINFSLPDSDAQNDAAKPDLSCTYYERKEVAPQKYTIVPHEATCELDENTSEKYLCRSNDGDKKAQSQIACEWKIERFQAWENQKNNP